MIFSSSVRYPFSSVTVSRAPSLWQLSAICSSSVCTCWNSRESSFETVITTSISFAPRRSRSRASYSLQAVLADPWGKLHTLPARTPLEPSVRSARSRSHGRTLTKATPRALASSIPATTCSSVRSGRTSEWPIIAATSS